MPEEQSNLEDISTLVDIYEEDGIIDLYLSSGSETLNGSAEKLFMSQENFMKDFYSRNMPYTALKNCKNYKQEFEAYPDSSGELTERYQPFNEKLKRKHCDHKDELLVNHQKNSDNWNKRNGEFKSGFSNSIQESIEQVQGFGRDGKANGNKPLGKTKIEKMKTYFHFSHWKGKNEFTEAFSLDSHPMFRDDSSSYYSDDSASEDGSEPLDKRILQEEHKRVVQSYRRLVFEPHSRIEAYGYI